MVLTAKCGFGCRSLKGEQVAVDEEQGKNLGGSEILKRNLMERGLSVVREIKCALTRIVEVAFPFGKLQIVRDVRPHN
jgi:hypothetical protein